jgi:hypothetical protein
VGPNRIRAAVFIDFDNIFGGLLDLDPKAAIAFAQEPQEWLSRLALVGAGDGVRSYLVRRCYMNPAGWRSHPALGPDRAFFSRYRPFFTKAGFEVVDCPSLTYRHKNAADIRICLDVVDTLSGATRYDEYVIASGDSDFTPLLQRLRASDRRITVVASSQTAVAYESVADLFLDEQEVIDLMIVGFTDERPAVASVSADSTIGVSTIHDDRTDESEPHLDENTSTSAFRAHVIAKLADTAEPVHLAELGKELLMSMGPVLRDTDWFGNRTLSRAVRALDLPGVVVSGHHVWDESRHERPESLETPPTTELPELVDRVCKVADIPRIDHSVWRALFEMLGHYAAEQDFTLAHCTRWVRDELAALGVDVGRQTVGFVVRGCDVRGLLGRSGSAAVGGRNSLRLSEQHGEAWGRRRPPPKCGGDPSATRLAAPGDIRRRPRSRRMIPGPGCPTTASVHRSQTRPRSPVPLPR